MPKFVIDLTLDGYDTEEEEYEACIEFIKEQLDICASSIKILDELTLELNKKSN